jgi:signal transduction histidine kinase
MRDYQEKIRIEAIQYIGQSGRNFVPGLVILPTVTVFVYWNSLPAAWLLIWWLASMALTAYRAWAISRINRTSPEVLSVPYWQRRITATALGSGCLWGLAVLLFFDSNTIGNQLYILAAIYGLTSISLVLGAYCTSGYYAFILPCLIAAIIRLYWVGSVEHLSFAFITLVYLFVLIKLVRRQKVMVESLMQLRFQNLDLVDELRRQKQRAEDISADKTRFLAAASHDLRQPLHAIGLFASALEARAGEAERSSLQKIIQSVNSLEGLLSTLLDISRIDAGAVKPEFVHCRIGPLLQRVMDALEMDAQRKGLDWSVSESRDVVITDPAMLYTILMNLASNAIRYTSKGSVRILSRRRGTSLVLAIVDTGVGIPKDQQKNIFKEFYRLPAEAQYAAAEGAGLGLATVKRLVSLMGCKLRLKSTPGKGTCFFLRLPIGESANFPKLPDQEVESYVAEDCPSVLVVDNNTDVCLGMEVLLKAWGCEVITALSVEDALQKLENIDAKPSVLIIDFHLGVMEGDHAIGLLKRILGDDIGVIMISGDGSKEVIEKARHSHAVLLQKPVQAPVLKAALMRLSILK